MNVITMVINVSMIIIIIIVFVHPTLATVSFLSVNESLQLATDTCRNAIDWKRHELETPVALGPLADYQLMDNARWEHVFLSCTSKTKPTDLQFCYGPIDSKVVVGTCLPEGECGGDLPAIVSALSNGSADQMTCLRSEWRRQWYEKPWALADFSFFLFLITLGVVAAICERFFIGAAAKSLPWRLLFAFSVTGNIKRLCRYPKNPESIIGCLYGLRLFSIVWVVIGHSYNTVRSFVSNYDQFATDLRDPFFIQLLTNFTLSVDIFFVISGTLTAYSWFCKARFNRERMETDMRSVAYWLRYYRHRLVRLWPAYAFQLVSMTLRLTIMHHHQTWPVVNPAVQCRSEWWKLLLFLNSIWPSNCLFPYAWYLANDFLFYLLSPIFLVLLHHRPRLGALLVATVCTASVMLRIGLNAVYNFPPTQLIYFTPSQFSGDFLQHYWTVYAKPYTRIGPYLIGIVTGYILSRSKKYQAEDLSPLTKATGWVCSVVLGMWAIFGLYPAIQDWPWPIYHLLYGGLHRTVFALAIAWLVFACQTANAPQWLNAALSAKIIVPFANLSYGVYLVHFLPIVAIYLWFPFPIVWHGHGTIAGHLCLQLLGSFAYALLVTLNVELPPLQIEQQLLRWCAKRTTTKASVVVTGKETKDANKIVGDVNLPSVVTDAQQPKTV